MIPLTKLQTRIIEYLEKHQDAPVPRDTILAVAKEVGYKERDVWDAMKGLTEVAHIGQWRDQTTKVNYLRFYPQNDLTRAVQVCLDRGEDW